MTIKTPGGLLLLSIKNKHCHIKDSYLGARLDCCNTVSTVSCFTLTSRLDNVTVNISPGRHERWASQGCWNPACREDKQSCCSALPLPRSPEESQVPFKYTSGTIVKICYTPKHLRATCLQMEKQSFELFKKFKFPTYVEDSLFVRWLLKFKHHTNVGLVSVWSIFTSVWWCVVCMTEQNSHEPPVTHWLWHHTVCWDRCDSKRTFSSRRCRQETYWLNPGVSNNLKGTFLWI